MMLLNVAFFAVSAASVLAGLVLLLQFFRRPVDLARPECRRCAYDLRRWDYFIGMPTHCPRCKAPLGRRLVRFARGRRAWGKLAKAVALLLAPLPLFFGILFIVEYQTGDGYKTTAQLIQDVKRASQPPMFELQRRLQRGNLSKGDVAGVLQAWQGTLQGRGMMPHSDEEIQFLLDANARGLVAPDLRNSVLQTAAGTPTLTDDTNDTQAKALRLKIDFGPSVGVFAFSRGGKRVVALRQLATSDGTVVASRIRADRPDQLSGTHDLTIELDSPLPRGKLQLTAILDCGVLSADSPLVGVGGSPGTPEKWQTPLAVWEATVTVTVMGGDR